jgi:hypothetical protein
LKEAELLQWFVREGDWVEAFGRLCEVQSDKATVELTSPYAGGCYQHRGAECEANSGSGLRLGGPAGRLPQPT